MVGVVNRDGHTTFRRDLPREFGDVPSLAFHRCDGGRLPCDLFGETLNKTIPPSATTKTCTVTSPHELGWPVRRSRRFSVALNRATVIWMGPVALNLVQEHFASMFSKRCELDVSVFAGLDSQENIDAERTFRASKAGHADPHGFFGELSAEDCVMTQRAKQRVTDFRRKAGTKTKTKHNKNNRKRKQKKQKQKNKKKQKQQKP